MLERSTINANEEFDIMVAKANLKAVDGGKVTMNKATKVLVEDLRAVRGLLSEATGNQDVKVEDALRLFDLMGPISEMKKEKGGDGEPTGDEMLTMVHDDIVRCSTVARDMLGSDTMEHTLDVFERLCASSGDLDEGSMRLAKAVSEEAFGPRGTEAEAVLYVFDRMFDWEPEESSEDDDDGDEE